MLRTIARIDDQGKHVTVGTPLHGGGAAFDVGREVQHQATVGGGSAVFASHPVEDGIVDGAEHTDVGNASHARPTPGCVERHGAVFVGRSHVLRPWLSGCFSTFFDRAWVKHRGQCLRLNEAHSQRQEEHQQKEGCHPLCVPQRPRWGFHQGEWAARGCYGFGVMTAKNERLRGKCSAPSPCASYTG